MNPVTDYIESGILELYVMGVISPEESREVERMAALHPEVRQEMNVIRTALEEYALAHAIQPKASVKALFLATIDYMERIKQGEPVTFPPVLTETSQPADFADWLHRRDLIAPPDFQDLYVKVIGATPEQTTAIVWIKQLADEEVHHDEYERFLIVEGTCTITAGEEAYHLVPGDFYAVPLHTPHSVTVTSAIPCKAIIQRLAA